MSAHPSGNDDQVRRIKCRFCDWSILPFRVLASGKTRGPSQAFVILRDHIEAEHPDEYDSIYSRRESV